ncbi:MAG: Trk system potassium transporter TrkA [Rhodospirillales bacterium]
MKVMICGAGQVGFNIARHLALENNDVTVVDRDPDLIRRVSDTMDAKGVVGHAAHPDVLERAGLADCELIIAVTYVDEVNMIACQVAHSLFGVTTKIARVRAQTYLNPVWANLFSRDNMPIDVIISPEIEVARSIARRLGAPGAFEIIRLADDKVRLVGVKCGDNCPLVNTPLRQLTQLFPELKIFILGVTREGKSWMPSPEEQLLVGDDAYFVVESDQFERAMTAFGHEEPEARRVLILGGGNIGAFLAREIEEQHPWVRANIVEMDEKRAKMISAGLGGAVTVIQGDVLDPVILEEASEGAETVIAVTNDDETNILASLLAKRAGAARAITLVNSATYDNLVGALGVDAVVSPRNITVSTILQHIRRGRIHSVHALREGFGELIEAEAMPTSDLAGKELKDIRLPDKVRVGAIVRGGEMIYPRGSAVIEAGDRVIMFAAAEHVRKVEKMFSVRLEFI